MVPQSDLKRIVGNGWDPLSMFASLEAGQAEQDAAGAELRRGRILDQVLQDLKQLNEAPSVALRGSASRIVAFIVDEDGKLGVDLQSFASKVGLGGCQDMGEMSLLAVHSFSEELRKRIFEALKCEDQQARDIREKVRNRQKEMTEAQEQSKQHILLTFQSRLRAQVANEVAAGAAGLCSCIRNDKVQGTGFLTSLERGAEEASQIQDTIAASLSKAQEQLSIANKDKQEADKHVKEFAAILEKHQGSWQPDVYGDSADSDKKEAQQIMTLLKGVAQATTDRVERTKKLVEALELCHYECKVTVQGDRDQASAQSVEHMKSKKLLDMWVRLSKRAEKVFADRASRDKQLEAITNQTKVRVLDFFCFWLK